MVRTYRNQFTPWIPGALVTYLGAIKPTVSMPARIANDFITNMIKG